MTDSSGGGTVARPTEQLPVPLFESVVLAVRGPDAQIYMALRDLCEALGLDPSSQRRRIVANESLHLMPFRVLIDRQFRTQDFLLLEDVPVWLMSIQERRVSPEIRERFAYVKRYLTTAVRAAFAQLTGLPESTSRQIEDLRDLDQMDPALKLLADLDQRQVTLEASQDRARTVFRDLAATVQDLRDRVQHLEQQVKNQMSPMQRNTIYRMVQRWGSARAERDSKLSTGAAIRRCWLELNERFAISTYTDLSAARYDEAVQFVKHQYRALTGQDLDAVEQTGMEI